MNLERTGNRDSKDNDLYNVFPLESEKQKDKRKETAESENILKTAESIFRDATNSESRVSSLHLKARPSYFKDSNLLQEIADLRSQQSKIEVSIRALEEANEKIKNCQLLLISGTDSKKEEEGAFSTIKSELDIQISQKQKNLEQLKVALSSKDEELQSELSEGAQMYISTCSIPLDEIPNNDLRGMVMTSMAKLFSTELALFKTFEEKDPFLAAHFLYSLKTESAEQLCSKILNYLDKVFPPHVIQLAKELISYEIAFDAVKGGKNLTAFRMSQTPFQLFLEHIVKKNIKSVSRGFNDIIDRHIAIGKTYEIDPNRISVKLWQTKESVIKQNRKRLCEKTISAFSLVNNGLVSIDKLTHVETNLVPEDLKIIYNYMYEQLHEYLLGSE